MTQNVLFQIPFFLLNFISIYTSKIIVIPFRTNTTENINISQKFLQKYLYTENLIGSPPQTININIFQDEYNFYLGENKCNKIPATYYKCSESSTYKTKTNLIEDEYFGEGYISQEFFSFYNSTNLKSNITSSNLTFFSSKNSKDDEKKQICAVLGVRLEPSPFDYDYTTSFIDIIKHINLTKDYYWSYIFFEKDKNNKIKNIEGINNEYIMKNYEGLLILGDAPHEYDNNKYKESDLTNINANKRYSDLYWDIVFKNIYFLQKNNSIFNLNVSVQASLDISLNYISAPFSVFRNITEYFFKDYIDNNKCKINQVINDDIYIYNVISCNKKDFNENDIKKFPTIYFEHVDYNYTFNLTCDDLFEEFNDSILFLIYSLENSAINWRFGKIFLRKYKFIFNQIYKTIGFYRNTYNENYKNEKEDENDRENNFGFLTNKSFWINFAWITVCIICLVVGAYFGHNYIKKEKKRRANELRDDDYDYSTQNNINE